MFVFSQGEIRLSNRENRVHDGDQQSQDGFSAISEYASSSTVGSKICYSGNEL